MQKAENLSVEIARSNFNSLIPEQSIAYTLSFEHVGQHLIDVVLTFIAQAQQELWLPVWVPGSYLIREFSRHLSTVKATCADLNASSSRIIHAEKITKNRVIDEPRF